MSESNTSGLEKQLALFEQIARSALAQWGIDGQTAKIELLKYRENGVYAVHASDQKYALRIHRPGYHSTDALRSELQWMDALKQSGISVPVVVPTTSGSFLATVGDDHSPTTYNVDLFEWIEGENMDAVVEQMGEDTELLINLKTSIPVQRGAR